MKKPIAIGCCSAVFITLAVGAYAMHSQEPVLRELSERERYWQKEVQRLGAHDAYEALAHAVEGKPISEQHGEAHAFGAALFAEEDVAGLPVCDDRFSFGCYHEFLGRAIVAHGVESVKGLNDGCYESNTRSPLSCQHGIGHGIAAYFGYDDAALRASLTECSRLDKSDPIGGCYGGVFMEYNVRTMLGEAAEPRPLAGNQFAPCDALPDEFVVPCIYWQPQWWTEGVFRGAPKEEMYIAMGEYCREFAKTPEEKRACFEGIGNMTPMQSGFDPVVAKKLCDLLSDGGYPRLLCRAIAADHFVTDVDMDAAISVCGDLSERDRAFCLAYTGASAEEFSMKLPYTIE